MSRSKKVWSDLKYWFLILIFLGFLFEMVASMLLYRKYTTGKLAILHFTEGLFKNGPGSESYAMHQKARPDSSQPVSRQIADESFEARNFAYEPWMMFRVADFRSPYVNVNGFERKSSPAHYINSSSKDTVDIYFFGGSSMFGTNLADAETIPSQFVKIAQKNNPVKSVRVRNFGVPHYYSKQELILLTSLLFSGDKPDLVVFLNGMEDFHSARMLYYDEPFYSYALQQSFEGKMFQKDNPAFVDSTSSLHENPPGIDPQHYNAKLYSKYVKNLKNAALLCEKAGVKSYFFCQPVPWFNFNTANSAPNTSVARFNTIYTMLEKNSDSIPNFSFLGNMLQTENASAFVGDMNYSPAFSQKVAATVFDTLKPNLQ